MCVCVRFATVLAQQTNYPPLIYVQGSPKDAAIILGWADFKVCAGVRVCVGVCATNHLNQRGCPSESCSTTVSNYPHLSKCLSSH